MDVMLLVHMYVGPGLIFSGKVFEFRNVSCEQLNGIATGLSNGDYIEWIYKDTYVPDKEELRLGIVPMIKTIFDAFDLDPEYTGDFPTLVLAQIILLPRQAHFADINRDVPRTQEMKGE